MRSYPLVVFWCGDKSAAVAFLSNKIGFGCAAADYWSKCLRSNKKPSSSATEATSAARMKQKGTITIGNVSISQALSLHIADMMGDDTHISDE